VRPASSSNRFSYVAPSPVRATLRKMRLYSAGATKQTRKEGEALWPETARRLRGPLRDFVRELMPVHRLSRLHEAQDHQEDGLLF